jgi:hypothetical protein
MAGAPTVSSRLDTASRRADELNGEGASATSTFSAVVA